MGLSLAFCLLGSVLFAHTGTRAKYVGAEVCISCHKGDRGPTWCKSFHPEDGVQCEACHGPGSLHVKAMKAGRMTEEAMLPKPKGKRFCMTCHAGVPHPTGKFNYKKFWRRVAHPLPKGSRR